ncbi:RNA methyltransferase [Chitinivibrio alkaliphilus]|uniref:SpoU rRNA methylase n=1 Tax=Chitinivibrio alkaliphilus ACht1 TaxID=1313304 RepID=U7DE61_9BACT|nr:RNA methyltransferase [Chitinivibrio alkaliphilus]ERP39211.1 SpoU rRNA methylase [Chitinivibrio alkaliphilus ACht1]
MSYSIVLVEPENPKNIGFVARAMKCNACTDLRIVSPHGESIHSEAYITGVSARPILSSARVYKSLLDAVADCTTVIGFSRRTFKEGPRKRTLAELQKSLICRETSALVFGRESCGLTREEMLCCHLLCTIPSAPAMSYNLGQAAAIALYSLSYGAEQAEPVYASSTEPAPTHGEEESLFKFLAHAVPNDIFTKGQRADNMRRIIHKMGCTRDELHLFMGLLKSIGKDT